MRLTLVVLALAASLLAQTTPTDSHLPIKRVVLYKNGVGYFEHVGKVRGTEDVNIDFTSSQLDDVIKSLTIVDYGEGRVTGVRCNSTAPLEQRLRGLRIPLSANPTREELLNALRGARVDVRSGTASAQIQLRQQEMNNISSDQSRVRENMKALKGSAEEKALLQRYASQLNSQEDRINALRTELDTIRKQRESASQELNSMLVNLNFDEDFPGK